MKKKKKTIIIKCIYALICRESTTATTTTMTTARKETLRFRNELFSILHRNCIYFRDSFVIYVFAYFFRLCHILSEQIFLVVNFI